MNRILCYLNRGCTCNHSRHMQWLDRMKRIVEQIETAANLEDGFEFFTPDLSQLIESDKQQNVLLCFWRDGDAIDDIENLPSITAGIMREYAECLIAAATRIDAIGRQGVQA